MLPEWLADPGLARLWSLVHERLEQRGEAWRGRATLTVASEQERRAVSSLLGRPLRTARVTIDVAALDGLTTNAGGIVAVVTSAVGPITDRRTERQRRARERELPVEAARELVRHQPWADEWLAFVRRAAPEPRHAHQAGMLLSRLLDEHEPVARQDLAAGTCGDAHALDDRAVLSTLVLRGLALALGQLPAEHARARRELWAVAGVRLDSVSVTALTLSLPGLEEGRPRHLTGRDLDLLRPAPTMVLVCENPRVLEAVADERPDQAVVCAGGNPNLVVLDVLRLLHAGGAELRYHGDFDWPGLAIADRLIAAVGVRPWMMGAQDYLAAEGSLPLKGRPHEASWDGLLSEAMSRRGVAVHEEAVLQHVLAALRS